MLVAQLRTRQHHRQLERGLKRFHNLLRLIELGANAELIEHGQQLLDMSLDELGMTEPELARMYPRFRFVQMAREAAARRRANAKARMDCAAN